MNNIVPAVTKMITRIMIPIVKNFLFMFFSIYLELYKYFVDFELI